MKKKLAACLLSGAICLGAVFPAGALEAMLPAIQQRSAEESHVYGQPTFVWADNYSACHAVFSCQEDDCGEQRTVECNVTSSRTESTCAQAGSVTYTAVAIFNGLQYEDQQTVPLEQPDHTLDGDPVFVWSEDKSSCEAVFTCSVCGTEFPVTCRVTTATEDATCTRSGSVTYTATAIFNGMSYTDTCVETVAKIDHIYSEPVFEWADDRQSCEAVFTCTMCGDEQRVSCILTDTTTDATCTEDGSIVYTAIAVFENQSYREEQTVTLEKLGHTYTAPTFVWSEDLRSCQAEFTCTRCGEALLAACKIEETEADGQIFHTASCTLDGTEYRDTVTIGSVQTTPVEEIFSDVLPSDWFYEAVQYVYDNGLMAGVGNGRFCPNDSMTRAMVVQVLYNSEEHETAEDPQRKPSFTDVSTDAWYFEAVEWANETGVSAGTGNGKFSPNDRITREQFVTMLYNYAGKPGTDGALLFSDADTVSSWAVDAMTWAYENGILSGKQMSDGGVILAPKDTATRAEAASMLMYFFELDV